jgi:hypothetical protein
MERGKEWNCVLCLSFLDLLLCSVPSPFCFAPEVISAEICEREKEKEESGKEKKKIKLKGWSRGPTQPPAATRTLGNPPEYIGS